MDYNKKSDNISNNYEEFDSISLKKSKNKLDYPINKNSYSISKIFKLLRNNKYDKIFKLIDNRTITNLDIKDKNNNYFIHYIINNNNKEFLKNIYN